MQDSRTIPAIALLMVLILAACGSDSEPETTQSADDPAATPVEDATPTPTAPATEASARLDTEIASPEPTSEPTITARLPGWTMLNPEAPWSERAGLRVVEMDSTLFLLGGRTPNDSDLPGDSQIWGDVWTSRDFGITWEQVLETDDETHWPARAYFQTVVKDDQIFVLGGQNYSLSENPFCDLYDQGVQPPPGIPFDPDAPCPEFLPASEFFNDVWSSSDGIEWNELTAAAPWQGRAGLSAVVLGEYIYVLGGSMNDDSAIIGPEGPQRVYFNDVWRSGDGAEWELVTDAAPWEPRAGAVLIVKNDKLMLLGGEDGFTCQPLPECEPPYFNDVWSSTDGSTWELITEAAGWSARPGHACDQISGTILCFGGFGLLENPMDIWSSPDGATWTQLEQVPWNATDQSQIKYDFAWLATPPDPDGGQAILTFGGDRETFDFADPDNYLRVDNDVWALWR